LTAASNVLSRVGRRTSEYRVIHLGDRDDDTCSTGGLQDPGGSAILAI
jgi:hypothetical protein